MAELADAYGSGPYESKIMQVQVLLSAPTDFASYCISRTQIFLTTFTFPIFFSDSRYLLCICKYLLSIVLQTSEYLGIFHYCFNSLFGSIFRCIDAHIVIFRTCPIRFRMVFVIIGTVFVYLIDSLYSL